MLFDIRPLFRPSFWFGAHPAPLMAVNARILFVVFAVMVVVGGLTLVLGKKRFSEKDLREATRRVSRMLTTMGVWGMVWLFFATERVTLFQARYWMLVWVMAVVIWKVSIWRFVTQTIPQNRMRKMEKQERGKYFAKKR